eukprot:6619612-Ditylum_brightwellii.AAC.2
MVLLSVLCLNTIKYDNTVYNYIYYQNVYTQPNYFHHNNPCIGSWPEPENDTVDPWIKDHHTDYYGDTAKLP